MHWIAQTFWTHTETSASNKKDCLSASSEFEVLRWFWRLLWAKKCLLCLNYVTNADCSTLRYNFFSWFMLESFKVSKFSHFEARNVIFVFPNKILQEASGKLFLLPPVSEITLTSLSWEARFFHLPFAY